MVYRNASPEAVAIAWAAKAPGFTAAMVGEELPTDNTTWAASGFVVPTVSGGGSAMNYQLGSPVVTFTCWACKPDSAYVPWHKARNLAEALRKATYLNLPVDVALTDTDENARVLTTRPVGEPRRTYADMGDYAAFVIDIEMNWVVIQ